MNPKRQQLSQIVKEHDGDDHRHSETTAAYVYIDTQRWSHDGARRLSRTGGADRDRTGDPLLAKQALSQLSYSPSPASPATAPETAKRQENLREPGI